MLSLAVFRGDTLLASHDDPSATGQAEALLPAIAALVPDGRADCVIVETGPGSFTGLRIGLAAGSGLALAWGAELQGVTSSALVAAPLFERYGHDVIWACLGAPRGQVWLEPVGRDGCRSLAEPQSLRDPALASLAASAALAGTAAAVMAVGTPLAVEPPLARNWRPGIAAAPAFPRYVRPADHVGA